MEFLYVLDIREIFRDRKQLIFTGIMTLAILAAFQYDLIGYNRWLPDPSEVESISMTDINNFTDMRFVNEYEECSRSADGQSVQYKMHVRKELDNQYTFTQDRLEDAYALIRHSIPFTEGKMKQYFPEDDEQIWYRGGTMIFRMKDGSTKYRSYIFREQELLTYLVPIWESDEYKEKVYPILQVKPEQVINVVAARDRWSFDGGIVEEELPAKDAASGTVKVEAKTIRSETAASETVGPEEETLQEDEEIRPDNPLTSAQKKEILETLQKDLREEKLSLFPDYDYVINVVYHGTDGKVYGEEYCLSADFQDTLNVLKDCGFELK